MKLVLVINKKSVPATPEEFRAQFRRDMRRIQSQNKEARILKILAKRKGETQ